jgi:hypothetical protein
MTLDILVGRTLLKKSTTRNLKMVRSENYNEYWNFILSTSSILNIWNKRRQQVGTKSSEYNTFSKIFKEILTVTEIQRGYYTEAIMCQQVCHIWMTVHSCPRWHNFSILFNYWKADVCHKSYRLRDMTSLWVSTSFSVLSFLL